MAGLMLRLFTDRLAAGAAALPCAAGINRVLYVTEGTALIEGEGTVASLASNSAWHGSGAVALRAGAKAALVLRFELAVAAAARSNEDAIPPTLAAPLAIDPAQPHLLRCDRVDFPPGGVAFTHMHQGPGIRCLQSGTIRIESGGASHDYAPSEAWFESGPEPVFAAASETAPSHFIRVMILPRALIGRSSIRYLHPEDQDKPKRQSYQIFIDAPIAL